MTDPQTAPPHDAVPAGEPSPPTSQQPPAGPTPATAPGSESTVREVQYKGAPLDAAKGPGLGCFWIQLAALAVLVVVTPLSAGWGWPDIVSGALLVATLVLLLFAGQTVIFLLRLVAADRRAEQRRVPLASRTPTVGQIEDEGAGGDGTAIDPTSDDRGSDGPGVPE